MEQMGSSYWEKAEVQELRPVGLHTTFIITMWKEAEDSFKHWWRSGLVLWSVRIMISASPVRVWRCGDASWENIWGKKSRNYSHLAWKGRSELCIFWSGLVFVPRTLTWSQWLTLAHRPRVYHLHMAICPSVERHFDCWCSKARPHPQSRWHERSASGAFFSWHALLMNVEIISEYSQDSLSRFLITGCLRHCCRWLWVANIFLSWLLVLDLLQYQLVMWTGAP